MVRAKLWPERGWSTRWSVLPRLPDAGDAGTGPEREQPAGPQEGQARVLRTLRAHCEPVRGILCQNLRVSRREERVKER